MTKYNLTKLEAPAKCWYEIPVDQVKTLFEDPDFNGEIIHLYNDSEDGAETLIQTDEELGDAIFEALENRTSFVIHLNDVYAQQELFEIRETVNND